MPRPRLLDLFCGAGGAAMGYHRAGFDVVGVDIEPQPHYPFECVQDDALEFLEEVVTGFREWQRFDAIHASPPCQDHSKTQYTHGGPRHGTGYMLEETIRLVKATGLPWVVENVEGPTVKMDGWWATYCGTAYGLNSRRHRRFASSIMLMPPPCRHKEFPLALGVNGHSEQGHVFRKWRAAVGRTPLKADREAAMGIDWMTRDELSQAIPPAMTEDIGAQLLQHLQAAAPQGARP